MLLYCQSLPQELLLRLAPPDFYSPCHHPSKKGRPPHLYSPVQSVVRSFGGGGLDWVTRSTSSCLTTIQPLCKSRSECRAQVASRFHVLTLLLLCLATSAGSAALTSRISACAGNFMKSILQCTLARAPLYLSHKWVWLLNVARLAFALTNLFHTYAKSV